MTQSLTGLTHYTVVGECRKGIHTIDFAFLYAKNFTHATTNINLDHLSIPLYTVIIRS